MFARDVPLDKSRRCRSQKCHDPLKDCMISGRQLVTDGAFDRECALHGRPRRHALVEEIETLLPPWCWPRRIDDAPIQTKQMDVGPILCSAMCTAIELEPGPSEIESERRHSAAITRRGGAAGLPRARRPRSRRAS